MDKETLQELIAKYLNGTATESELADLHRWYMEKSEDGAEWPMEYPGEYSSLKNRVFHHVNDHINSNKPVKRQLMSPIAWRVAATILIFAAAYITYYFAYKNIPQPADQYFVVKAPQKSLSNRYLLLPDSSIVILRAGSELKYAYSKKLRSIYLSGEAYFDVRHHQDRPFVVYTGMSKTTVLGTAFNISAFPGQAITVTVSRGKVSVENGKEKRLTLLTPNQQLSIQSYRSEVGTVAVPAQQVVDWTRSDMQFEKITFKELAQRLGNRYNRNIKFSNAELEKCLITGRFTGMEPLEEVLLTISQTMGTSYKIDSNVIQINGNACP